MTKATRSVDIPCDLLDMAHDYREYSRRERKRFAVELDGRSVSIWLPRRFVRGLHVLAGWSHGRGIFTAVGLVVPVSDKPLEHVLIMGTLTSELEGDVMLWHRLYANTVRALGIDPFRVRKPNDRGATGGGPPDAQP
jgi:hypothetical protein